MATAVAGLTLASQIASASLLMPEKGITTADVQQGIPGRTEYKCFSWKKCNGANAQLCFHWRSSHCLIDCSTNTHPLTVSLLSTVNTGQARLSSNSILMVALGNVETMDFSMPSYEGSSLKPKDAPTFNPFGDFEPKILDSEAEAQRAVEKAAEKAAKEADAAVCAHCL